MVGIAQLLQFLDRDDVSEIILQTGKALTARVAGQLRTFDRTPLHGRQIDALLAEPGFSRLRQTGQPEPISIDGRNFLATVMRRGDVVMVRLAKSADATAADPGARATPTYASRAVDPPIAAASQRPTRPRVATVSPAQPARPAPPPVSSSTPTLRPGRTPIEVPSIGPAASMVGPGMFGNSFEPPDADPRAIDIPHPDSSHDAGGISIEPLLTRGSAIEAPAATLVSPPPSFSTPAFAPPAPAFAPRQPQPATPAPVAPPPTITESDPGATAAPSIEDLLATQPWTPGSFQPTFDPLMLQLFQAARQQAASDLHVVAARAPQIRLVGELRPLGEALDPARVESLLLPLLDERSAAQLQKLGYADLAFEVPGAGRVRANVNRQKTGLKGCFRLILAEPPTLEQLGLPEELSKVTKYHQGLAIVSGPTGHGKTTTMAALVDLINSSKQSHIITVEDPVEIVHPKKMAVISQRQVGSHTDTFKAALKGALREDPDVIVIGELRDVETVEMALSAAETGHLVIATMSTPSGAKTIDRLIDMFPPEDQSQVRATLAGALKIIISQRLLPRADGTSLVAAAELITGSFPLWNMIRDDKLYQLPSLVQRGRSFGMIRIEDSLRKLLDDKVITMEAAVRVAGDPRALQAPVASAVPSGFKPKGVKAPPPEPLPAAPAPDDKKSAVRPPYGKGT